MIEKTYEVKFSSQKMVNRFERLLALIHKSSSGHSSLFAIPIDGDGSDRIMIHGLPEGYIHEADLIAGVGYDVEVALDNSFSGKFINSDKEPKWYTGPAANLYKDGDVVKTCPSCDWNHPKNK